MVAAFNDAARKVDATVSEKMSGMTAGLGLPAWFKLPF
jgi:DNA-binding protein YbaB